MGESEFILTTAQTFLLLFRKRFNKILKSREVQERTVPQIARTDTN